MTYMTYICTNLSKIMFSYRVIFNHSGHLNKRGEGLVSIEVRDKQKRFYFSTGIHVKPNQWDNMKEEIIDHPLANEYREYIFNKRYSIERVELTLRNRGTEVSLERLRQAYKLNVNPSATLKEFTFSVIENSSRSPQTKNAYKTMLTSIEGFQKDLRVSDITHDWIERWRTDMRNKGLSDNTIKGRLKQLHCITQEAIKRDIITSDPFKWITIGNMTPKKEFLTMKEIKKLEIN